MKRDCSLPVRAESCVLDAAHHSMHAVQLLHSLNCDVKRVTDFGSLIVVEVLSVQLEEAVRVTHL